MHKFYANDRRGRVRGDEVLETSCNQVVLYCGVGECVRQFLCHAVEPPVPACGWQSSIDDDLQPPSVTSNRIVSYIFWMNSSWTEITWRPTIGDPEPIGWVITFTYFIVGAVCISAGRHQRAIAIHHGCVAYPWFWFGLGAFLFALGSNKQLDLQMVLIQIGRVVAKRGGWYSEIKTIKDAVIFCFGAFALPVVSAWMCAVCSRGRPYIPSGLGVLVLLVFIILRASSYHPQVKQLSHLPLIGSHLNIALELSGTCLVGCGAWMSNRRTP